MQQLEITIHNPVGLHARPAASLVQTAMGFKSTIFLEKNGCKANAKSLLSVLSLGVQCGEQVVFRADGVDEAEALAAIKMLAAHNFGDTVRKEVSG